MADGAKVSDSTEVTIPLRNLISIIGGVAIATWAYFALQERVNALEHDLAMVKVELAMNSEFRIKWPRGELGSLPADARQDMLIEALSIEVSKQADMQLTQNEHRVQIELLKERITEVVKPK